MIDIKILTNRILLVKSDDSLLVSGAGDSTLIIWKDVTKEEREAALKEKESRILEEQQLANLMQKGLLLEALGLAIHLDQPFRTLNILKGTFLSYLYFVGLE